MELYKYQQELLDLNPTNHLLAWGCGTGKSRTFIELINKNTPHSALVICTKGLKENWRREIQKWATSPERFMVMSKEEFKRDWMAIQLFEAVGVDEAHYFAGTSQMTKSLQKYLERARPRLRYLLTATPFLSSPWNIFLLGKHLGANWDYMHWKMQYFNLVSFGMRAVFIPKKGIESEMRKHILSVGSIATMEDVPEQVFETEHLELSKEQLKAIAGNDESNFLTKYIKQFQIENGVKIGDEYVPDEFYETAKNERILRVLEEKGKIAVCARFNLQVEYIARYLREHTKDIPIYVLRGDTKNRQEMVDTVNAAEKCVIIIQMAISEGYELPTIGTIIFASLSFSYKEYVQMRGRFLRANAKKSNYYLHLLSGEVDTAVYASMMRKEDFVLEMFKPKDI